MDGRGASCFLGDRRQSITDFPELWPGNPLDDPSAPHEDERRPELDPEGASQSPPRPVLDLDVADGGMGVEEPGQHGCEFQAIAAPACAELQQDRPLHPLDLGSATSMT